MAGGPVEIWPDGSDAVITGVRSPPLRGVEDSKVGGLAGKGRG